MNLANLMDGMGRAPWQSVARRMLERAKYDVSRGHGQTAKAILASTCDPAKVSALETGLIEHLVAGEKVIQIVQLQKGERAQIDSWIRGQQRQGHVLTDACPGVASQSDIVSCNGQVPASAGFFELEDGVAAIFTATRSYIHSVPIPVASLVVGAASGFERIIGYKKVFVQVYDAIWLPNKGDFVVLTVDNPANANHDFPLAGLAYLNFLLKPQLGRILKIANLWHAIDGLYSSSDGKLVEYGFAVSGQSVNHHKARRKLAPCLRKADYDAGGAAAVIAAGGELALFNSAMQWGFKHHDGVMTEPEVLLPGTAADLNKAMPVVNHCIVRGCLSTSDLSFMVNKVSAHIKYWV